MRLLQESDTVRCKLSGLNFPAIIFECLHQLISGGLDSIRADGEHGPLVLCLTYLFSNLRTMSLNNLLVEILWETHSDMNGKSLITLLFYKIRAKKRLHPALPCHGLPAYCVEVALPYH